jgi:hypothetical protein
MAVVDDVEQAAMAESIGTRRMARLEQLVEIEDDDNSS